MNWGSLWTSITLVVVGALISFGTTYLIERGKDRRARRAAEEQREVERADALRAQGVDVVMRLYEDLNNLWRLHIGQDHALVGDGIVGADPSGQALRRDIYNRYLLVPDPTLRQMIQDGMYAVGNEPALRALSEPRRHTAPEEAAEVLMVMRNALAAYLRGDKQRSEDVAYLEGIRLDLDERFGVY